MKKLFKEFKTFITRGNVLDLAVGMIIGAAFTAIVTALVNGIFKPLINWIPMGDVNGLITPLEMVYVVDATGAKVVDWANSIYINWGDFIMAIVNFLITALVLFAIIKVINTFRERADLYKDIQLTKEQRAEYRAKGVRSYRRMLECEKERLDAEAAAAAAAAAAEAEANKAPSTEELLAEIRDLLKAGR